jgi:Domain of unknown function (DUF4337)
MSGGGHHVDANDPFQKRAAVAMAIYTVQLALANMLTNQARTNAILLSNRAANKWSYFQSKSTKQNLAKVESDILIRLPQNVQNAQAVQAGQKPDELVAKLNLEVERYEAEKATIQSEAQQLEEQGTHLEHKEHFYEYAATVVELAIVLAGVSLLMHSKKVLAASLGIACISLVILGYTYLLMH